MHKQWAAGAPVIGAAPVPSGKPKRPWPEGYQAVERSAFSYSYLLFHGDAASSRVLPKNAIRRTGSAKVQNKGFPHERRNGIRALVRYYHGIRQQVPGALLMCRLGDFYELFFDDAILAARNKKRHGQEFHSSFHNSSASDLRT